MESVFVDNQGRNTSRIERYKRLNDTIPWMIKDVWYANLTSSTAEKVEEDVRFIKLIFPVRAGDTWDGNAFNTLGEETYTYGDVNTPYSTILFNFDSTVTVIQRDDTSAIRREYSIEVYAKHIGMIYKKFISQGLDPVSGQVTDGTDYSYTAKGWGESH
jgi:hypothetical protein